MIIDNMKLKTELIKKLKKRAMDIRYFQNRILIYLPQKHSKGYFKLIDAQGRLVDLLQADRQVLELRKSNYAAGIYFLYGQGLGSSLIMQ